MPDTAYVCTRCCDPVRADLAAVPSLAVELEPARYRQTRYGSGGLGGWQEPWDDRVREVEHAVTNTLTTVARDVAETRGLELPTVSQLLAAPNLAASQHPMVVAARFLVGQLDWVRHQSEALATLDELRTSVRALRHVVDRPADREIAGQCACGEHLYAVRGSAFVTCQACGTSYDVAQVRDLLSKHIEQMLLTAAELASLAAHMGLTANRERVRKLVNVWSSRGIVVPKGDHAGQPTYRAGEVMTRLAASLTQSGQQAG